LECAEAIGALVVWVSSVSFPAALSTSKGNIQTTKAPIASAHSKLKPNRRFLRRGKRALFLLDRAGVVHYKGEVRLPVPDLIRQPAAAGPGLFS
jgi:hypothetical protein